ncbi:MAG TPA: carbohydrate ABC transporter permease [Chloroflexota bacterium]|nr:carbohydrate ABC transporter permease [Chloroflexota bacterium]
MSSRQQSPGALSVRPDQGRAAVLPRNRPRLRVRRLLVDLLVYVGLTIGMVAVVLPFVYMVASSLETIAQIGALTPQFWPDPPQWTNYQQVWQQLPVGQYFLNSLIVAVVVTGGQIITASMAAYAFARLRFRGRSVLFALYLGTLIIPSQVTLIPNYILIRILHWHNTYAGLIAPFLVSVFSTFLLRQFFLTISPELEDAARIDGASHFQIYLRIIMPLAKPALAALVIFTFLGSWNNFLWPLVVIDSPSLTTVPLSIVAFQGQYATAWNLLMVAATLSVAPVLIVYLLAQRYFVEGIALTGQGGR